MATSSDKGRAQVKGLLPHVVRERAEGRPKGGVVHRSGLIAFLKLTMVALGVLGNRADRPVLEIARVSGEDGMLRRKGQKADRPQGDDVCVEQDQAGETRSDRLAGTAREQLVEAQSLLKRMICEGDLGMDALQGAKARVDNALATDTMPALTRLIQRWTPLLYIVLAGLVEIVFIELYSRWHGARFLSLDLYDPENIAKLANLTFVNGPTTMSIAAEVMMWSSLGVWAKHAYETTRALAKDTPDYAMDIGGYVGMMVRNTSVAAIVVILLRLTQFSIFGVSLDASAPLAFDATIGVSFLLGFFGDEAYRILSSFMSRLVRAVTKTEEGDA